MLRRFARKPILSITAIVLIVAAVSGLVNVTTEEKQLLNAVLLEADELSKGITSATWHAMLDEAGVSLARLRQEFYGLPPNREVFVERARKEALHETGHLFGLVHRAGRSCAMSLKAAHHGRPAALQRQHQGVRRHPGHRPLHPLRKNQALRDPPLALIAPRSILETAW